MNSRHLFLGAFVITLGFIIFEEIKKCHDLPWPPRLIATALVFGLLDIFSAVQEDLAGVIAIGFTLATVVNTLSKQQGGQVFTANCQHAEATAQPASYQTLQGAPQGGQLV